MTQDELRLAANLGARFIIGSDAHSPDRVGDDALALKAAQDAGVLGAVVNVGVGIL
jgi:putative hydrolase